MQQAEPMCPSGVLAPIIMINFSLRTKDNRLQVFELDRPEMIADRQHSVSKSGLEPGCRQVCIGCDLALTGWKDDLVNAGFHVEKLFFGSLLGISYYLSKGTPFKKGR